MCNYDSKSFARKHYKVPRKFQLEWCLIDEKTENKQSVRIGLHLKDTSLYIDIARRCLCSAIKSPLISREFHPAIKKTLKDGYYFYCPESNLSKLVSKNYFASIYYQTVFRKEHLTDTLY